MRLIRHFHFIIYRHIMNNIQTFKFNTKDITCYVVNGDPYFRGNDVSSILGYACPGKAIIDHVPDRFKQSYQSLISSVGNPKTSHRDYNGKTTRLFNEAGLYKLIFRSKTNMLKHSPTGCVVKCYRPSGSMVPISLRKKLLGCMV